MLSIDWPKGPCKTQSRVCSSGSSISISRHEDLARRDSAKHSAESAALAAASAGMKKAWRRRFLPEEDLAPTDLVEVAKAQLLDSFSLPGRESWREDDIP